MSDDGAIYNPALADAELAAIGELLTGHKRELHCECGEWVLVPEPGEIVECNCGNRYECSKSTRS